jgi:hypothetical protein
LFIPDNLDTGKYRREQDTHCDHSRDQKFDIVPTSFGQLDNRVQAEPQKEQKEDRHTDAANDPAFGTGESFHIPEPDGVDDVHD